jgi:hypothetical protein
MDRKKIEDSEIEYKAVLLVREFFECLNKGELGSANAMLFHPKGVPDKSADKHIDMLAKLVPFENIKCSVTKIGEYRQARHGAEIASIWMELKFDCMLGSYSAEMVVWLFSKNEGMQIVTRLTQLVLEAIHFFDGFEGSS